MRGVVTLAAAFVIPEDTEHREVLLLIAFTVVAGTLLIQGLSLPWCSRGGCGCRGRTRWTTPWPAPRCSSRPRRPAIKELEEQEYDDPHGVIALIKQRVDQRNFAAWERLGTTVDEESPSELYCADPAGDDRGGARRVLEIRSAGSVASEVVADVLAMLDVEESMLDVATAARQELRASDRSARSQAGGVRPPRGVPPGRDGGRPGRARSA